ncbi:hypothetical protein P7C73_g3190, partial [Tremellales sp. Uapishka_1]
MKYEMRGVAVADDENENDNDMAVDDEDEDDGGDEGEGGRAKSWGKSIGMGSWRGTKALLTGKKKEEEREREDGGFGAPLKKSVSTGAFTGNSPLKLTIESDRKKAFLGSSPAGITSLLSSKRPSSTLAPTPLASNHRRNSSLESPTSSALLGSSPTGVKMLNGRVYGGRRLSEAAEAERRRQAKEEPAFVEWGHGKSVGTVSDPAENDDDGGGMSWVKRRREEREKERIEKEKAQTASSGISASRSLSTGLSVDTDTDKLSPIHQTKDLPTPVIHVSQYSPQNTTTPLPPPTPQQPKSEHITQAILIQPKHTPSPPMRGRDVFDGVDPLTKPESDEEDGEKEDEDGEKEEEDEDDGDFEEDDEEEPELRTTSSAAGVEVLSRHKD